MAAVPMTPQLRPLGVGEILDVGIKIYLRNWLTLSKIVVFVVLPAQILVAAVTWSAISDRTAPIQIYPDGRRVVDSHGLAVLLTGVLVASFIGYLAGQLAQAACFRAIADAYLGDTVSGRASLRFAVRRLPALVVLGIVTSIVVAVGLVCCIAPGIYFWGGFYVAVPVLLVEGSGPFRSMGRSRRLVQGRWWGTIGVAVVGYLLVLVVGFAFNRLLLGLIITQSARDTTTGLVLGTLVSTVASLLTTPAAAAFATVLYIDLRVRREGFDLYLLARGIGSDSTPAGGFPSYLPPARPPATSAQPPYWPPPPGWTPPPAPSVWDPAPEPEPEQPSGPKPPPFWPPPPGWTPGDT